MTERLAGDAGLARAIELLRTGAVVAIPTETVYGLAARADDPVAVAAIFAAKGRPADNPLIVHVDGRVGGLVADWPSAARALATAFWPGPLTLVARRADRVPDVVTAGRTTVALRSPRHPLALALVRAVGPLAAPSANRSGRPSPTTAAHVLADLDGRIAAVLDGGPCPDGLESTVVDVTTRPPMVLRPGPVTVARLEAVVGPIAVHPSVHAPDGGTDARAPGMRHRHYSPDATVVLFEGPDGAARAIAAVAEPGVHAVVVGPSAGPSITAFPDADTLGRALYAELRRLDALGVDRIVFGGVPPDATALLNRLRKASEPPTAR